MKKIIWLIVLAAWAWPSGHALAAQEYKRFRKYVTWST